MLRSFILPSIRKKGTTYAKSNPQTRIKRKEQKKHSSGLLLAWKNEKKRKEDDKRDESSKKGKKRGEKEGCVISHRETEIEGGWMRE